MEEKNHHLKGTLCAGGTEGIPETTDLWRIRDRLSSACLDRLQGHVIFGGR